MILETIVGFLVFDGVLAFFFWLLTVDDFRNVDTRMTQAEKARDRSIEDWFRAQSE